MSQLTELTHGERNSKEGVESIGLSPLPVTTGRKPITEHQFITHSDDGLLEIRQMNNNVYEIQVLLLCVLGTLILLACLWASGGEWYATIPALGMIAVAPVVIFYLDTKDKIKSAASRIPIRFHPQKQQILLSREKSNKPKPEKPDVLTGDSKTILMNFAAFVLVGTGTGVLLMGLDEISQGDFEVLLWAIPMLILGCYPGYYTLKLWITYLRQRKSYTSSIEITAVAWESIHIQYQGYESLVAEFYSDLRAHDELQAAIDFNPFRVGALSLPSLNFSAIIPDSPDNEQVLFNLQVHSYEEALSLYELLCDFMENGAQGIEHTAAANIKIDNSGYSREGYRRLIEKRAEETPLIYPFWRLLNVLTLRYFAHWYQEYLMETLQQKALNRPEVKQWSKLLPAEEWQKPSEALQQANKAVRKLYAQGHVWESEEVQQVVRRYRPEIEQVEDGSPYSRLTPWNKL